MGKNWGVTIGINHYRNATPLRYAERDAESMRDFFKHELRFDQVCHFIKDAPPIRLDGVSFASEPAYTSLRRFLKVQFEDAFLEVDDSLWFFFAGHGLRYQGYDYLMPVDGDPGDVEGTAIRLSYVTERLRRSGAENIILFLDACRNEGQRDGSGIGEEKQRGVITFFSCKPNEFSYEIIQLQHGAFTYVLLEGLQQGSGNGVTVEKLDRYLRERVKELNALYKRPRQTPYTVIEPISKSRLILLSQQAISNSNGSLKADAEVMPVGKRPTTVHIPRRSVLKFAGWTAIGLGTGVGSTILSVDLLAKISSNPTDPPARKPPPRSELPTTSPSTVASPSPTALRPSPTPAVTSSPTARELWFRFDVITVDRSGQVVDRLSREATGFIQALDDTTSLEMVNLPAGSYQRGSPATEIRRSPSESPLQRVSIPTFAIGRYPVTQAQWRAVAQLPKINRPLDSAPSAFVGSDRPVEQISWWEAIEFCQRLSQKTGWRYRLPSEAEWEYACRAGTSTPFHFGETITTELVNFDGDFAYQAAPKGRYRGETTPVTQFTSPSAFGLSDMHGNVWELCQDHWRRDYGRVPTDGRDWEDPALNYTRVIRGGAFDKKPWDCRSASRLPYLESWQQSNVGFRVAMTGYLSFPSSGLGTPLPKLPLGD
jgi:formylglycine-generating enzyme required for sulfatase activity